MPVFAPYFGKNEAWAGPATKISWQRIQVRVGRKAMQHASGTRKATQGVQISLFARKDTGTNAFFGKRNLYSLGCWAVRWEAEWCALHWREEYLLKDRSSSSWDYIDMSVRKCLHQIKRVIEEWGRVQIV